MTDESTEVWGVELTPERAGQVRKWRVEGDDTWRGVAWEADQAWGTGFESNQLFGQDLCMASARMLGEDPDADPWN